MVCFTNILLERNYCLFFFFFFWRNGLIFAIKEEGKLIGKEKDEDHCLNLRKRGEIISFYLGG